MVGTAHLTAESRPKARPQGHMGCGCTLHPAGARSLLPLRRQHRLEPYTALGRSPATTSCRPLPLHTVCSLIGCRRHPSPAARCQGTQARGTTDVLLLRQSVCFAANHCCTRLRARSGTCPGSLCKMQSAFKANVPRARAEAVSRRITVRVRADKVCIVNTKVGGSPQRFKSSPLLPAAKQLHNNTH